MPRLTCSPIKGEPEKEIITQGTTVIGWVLRREHGEFKWGALRREESMQGTDFVFNYRSKKEAIHKGLLGGAS